MTALRMHAHCMQARTMEERRRNLEAFKSGDLRFLISTDIAARGIDVKELPYVVNVRAWRNP